MFCFEPAAFASIYTSDSANAEAFDNNYQEVVADKKTKASLSAIEEMFNMKDAQVTGYVLRQVGYDLFNSPISTATSTGKFDNSYKLSVGEKVNVYIYGDAIDVMSISGSSILSPTTKTQVDSKGNIFVQGIGLVPAENRTISEVEASISKIASDKYRNLKVKLTVASGTEFSVFVYGQVNHPGRVAIGNNSSIFDVLNAAGGVKKTGTLRNISYSSAGRTKYIDLYKTFFTGSDDNIIVRPNDKIFVDKIGNVVALKNGVTNPGIYEIKQGETLQKITEYAGGLLPTTLETELIKTAFDKNKNQRVAENISWNNVKQTKLSGGDTFEFRKTYNDTENIVTIQGNIKHPATFAYKEGMRLSDILKSEDELLEETFINQAVIRRITGTDNTVETIPVFLSEFFSGMNDPILKPRDVISIYKNTNSDFVDIYGCINTPKHLTYKKGMTLKDVMTDIKFIESDITGTNEDTALKDETTENAEKTVSLKGNVEETSVQLEGNMLNSNRLIPTENVAVEITNGAGNTQLYYLYDIMINSDRIKLIKINAGDKIFFRTLRDNEIMKTVKISGFVKTPGVYKFVEGKKLTDIINQANGLNDDADLRGIVYTRKNIQAKQIALALKNNERDIKLLEGRLAGGYKQAEKDMNAKAEMIEMIKNEKSDIDKKYNGQIALNIKSNDLTKINKIDNIFVQDGDEIYIPRMSNHISVIGEVYNEQSFIYKKGTTVRSYIREVGGYTPNANRFRLYKVGVNGRAEKIRMVSSITPGDTIVVPRKIAGNDWLTPICDTLRGIASIIVMAFAINKW